MTVKDGETVKVFRTDGPDQTRALGARLGRALAPGDFVFLSGDLGTGKTTFIQGACRGLGVDESVPVRSPSFTLMHEYQGAFPVRHADLYRTGAQSDLETIGLFDSGFHGVTLVEWADRLPEEQRRGGVYVEMSDVSDTQRDVCIRGSDEILKRL